MKFPGILLPLFFILSYANASAQAPSLVLQKGHFNKVNSISFSKNGRQMITTSNDGSIKIWDTFSQRLMAELDGKGEKFAGAHFSPDGQYIIATSPSALLEDAPTINIYNNSTGAFVYTFTKKDHFGETASHMNIFTESNPNISPNGEFAVTHDPKKLTYDEAYSLNIKDIRDYPIIITKTSTGKPFATITNYIDNGSSQPLLLGFVSDSILLIGQGTDTVSTRYFLTKYHLYNFILNKEISSFVDTTLENKAGKLLFSPGRKYFLRYVNEFIGDTMYRGVRYPYTELWNVRDQKMLWHKPIRILDAAFGKNEGEMVLNYDTLNFFDYNNDNLILQKNQRMARFSLQNGRQLFPLPVTDLRNVYPAFSSGGTYIATAAKDTGYTISIRDKSNKVISLCQLNHAPTTMAFTPDERYLVTGYDNGNFSVWDFADPEGIEVAAVGNNIDPVQTMHNDYKSNTMVYVTRNMYGVQPAQTSGKIASFTTGNAPIKKIHYVLNGRYSVVDAGRNSWSGKLMIVDNDTPSVVKEIPYEMASSGSLSIESLRKANVMTDVGRGIMQSKLQHPELLSFSIYSQLVNEEKSGIPVPGNWMGFAGPRSDLTFGIVKSRHATDTVLLFSNFGKFKYNEQLKGYIYRGYFNYFIPRPELTIMPITDKIKLMGSILSEDARYTLGRKPDEGAKFRVGTVYDTAIINDDHKLYCLDIDGKFFFSTPIVYGKDSVGELSYFIFSPDRKTACILTEPQYAKADFVRVVNARTGAPMYNLKVIGGGTVLGAEFTKDSKYVYSWSEGGTCTKWDLDNGHEVYTIVFFQDHDYAIILPNGYYYISARTDAKYLNFKINSKLYNFSQFDLQFNRPDKVLQAIGSPDKNLIDEYYRAWQGRVRKSGFTEADVNSGGLHVPEILVSTDGIPPYSTEQKLNVSFTVTDSLFAIRSYNIFVNDVPVNGINGRTIVQALHRLEIQQTVLLSEGANKIEVSCVNEKGVSSRKETFFIKYHGQSVVKNKTWFIGIGINQYSAHSSFVDLSYCVKDIRDLSGAFKNKFKEDMIIDTLMNDQASRENILALKQKLMQTSVNDKVIISFSGHGMVDPLHPDDFYFATGNTDINNPAANGVSYAQLEELLDSIPARKKLMLLDACHSGESDGASGGASNHIPGTQRGIDDKNKNKAGSIEILDVVENGGPANAGVTDIFKLMKEAFVDIRRNNGAYVISAAQSNESAGEGGGITNGWFSSCLVAQLKGNASMSVNELSRRVNQCVSAKSSGNQNTDNRQELAEVDWLLW